MEIKDVLTGVCRGALKQNIEPNLVSRAAQAIERNYRVVEIQRNDDFVVAVLHDDENSLIYTGVSKRHPNDRFIPIRGEALALTRAVRRALDTELVAAEIVSESEIEEADFRSLVESTPLAE